MIYKSVIFLIGFMGAGKSAVGRALSTMLRVRYIDMDKFIEKENNKTINDIFATMGEDFFRDREYHFLKKIDARKRLIVSCGGGVPLFQRNVEIMQEKGIVIYLKATPETIHTRVKNSTARPLLKDNNTVEYIEHLMGEREEYYRKAMDFSVSVEGKNVNAIAREIISVI